MLTTGMLTTVSEIIHCWLIIGYFDYNVLNILSFNQFDFFNPCLEGDVISNIN